MRQYRCPVCGQKTDKKQCSSCGWDFTKDITKGFLLAQMSRAACRAYMQELQAQKKNYAGIQNADFYNYNKLPRLTMTRNPWCMHIHQKNILRQFFCF